MPVRSPAPFHGIGLAEHRNRHDTDAARLRRGGDSSDSPSGGAAVDVCLLDGYAEQSSVARKHPSVTQILLSESDALNVEIDALDAGRWIKVLALNGRWRG